MKFAGGVPMDFTSEAALLGKNWFTCRPKAPSFLGRRSSLKYPVWVSARTPRTSSRVDVKSILPCDIFGDFYRLGRRPLHCGFARAEPGHQASLESVGNDNGKGINGLKSGRPLLLKVVIAGVACTILLVRCREVFAAVGAAEALEQSRELVKGAWPKVLQVLVVFKEQGLILAGLLGLSAFFSMAETSITTLWPWKIRELAEKEPENGVFRLLRSDVNRFLTTILIGTTVVNIGATALVTDAATAVFGEAGVTAATGVMTVAVLLLTEITPKSIAVHNAAEVARIVVRPIAWLSLVLYPLGKVATFLSMEIQKLLGFKARSEPFVTEDELKLMLRGAELSGAIEEEEQDMIENVLEIKDTHVREVMTPLVDVIAIDASAKLIDFQKLWLNYQYSRVPVFEQRIDNIVGIAFAKDMLEFVEQVEKLENSSVGDIAQKPAYFVPDSMSVWNLLREFRIRKVHMAIVLNEYGGTVGIVTLEDVVEEIVGEIFDENDSKEEIQKKTGGVTTLKDGSFRVDANTSMDQLSEELNVKIPEGHQYETVSGFICEAFGCIPNKGKKIVVLLEKGDEEETTEYDDMESDNQELQKKNLMFELEVLEANERKVEFVLFRPIVDATANQVSKKRKRIIREPDRSDNDETSPLLEPAENGEDPGMPLACTNCVVIDEQADDLVNNSNKQ